MSRLSPLGRAIVQAAREGDRSTALDRARVRRKLAGAIAATTVLGTGAASGTAVAATKGALGGGLTWFLAPMAVVAAVGTGAAVHVSSSPSGAGDAAHTAAAPAAARPVLAALVGAHPSRAVAPFEPELAAAPQPPPPPAATEVQATESPVAAAPRAGDAVAPAAPARVAAAPAAPAAPVAAAAVVPVPVAAAPRATAASPGAPRPAAPAVDPLLAETERLRAVHGALHEGDPARALALLERGGERGGQLAEERAAARVVALCRLGRVAEGRAALARLATANAGSPYLARARASCGDE
jgi:hypothetical protein